VTNILKQIRMTCDDCQFPLPLNHQVDNNVKLFTMLKNETQIKIPQCRNSFKIQIEKSLKETNSKTITRMTAHFPDLVQALQ
jgi:hypothetical protein